VAPGSVVVVMASAGVVPGIVMVRDWTAVAVGSTESATLTVNVLVTAAAVGVPEITPDVLKVKPSGRDVVPEFNDHE